MNSNNHLRKYPLFANLSDAVLAQLSVRLTKRALAKGAYLYYPGNPAQSIYLVESGLMRLFFCDVRGQEFFLNLLGPLSVVGLPFIRKESIRLAGAAAMQTSAVLVLSLEDLTYFMNQSPQFAENINDQMDKTVRQLFLFTQSILTQNLLGRLATLLIFLSKGANWEENNDEIDLPLSQTEIASWLGASRGRINRALIKLQQSGLIQMNGQKITILDRPGLARMREC